MNDCPNADIRDQLPDLLHERLQAEAQAVVVAHVDGCADCCAELELLRGLRGMFAAQAPHVDVDYVVGALPKPPVRTIPLSPVRRQAWGNWRIAAAVTVLVVGGSSAAVMTRGAGKQAVAPIAPALQPLPSTSQAPETASSAVTTPVVPDAPTLRAAQTVATTGDANGIGVAGRLSDLDDGELKALLNDIDHLQAVPVTEPEPVTIKLDTRTPPGSEGA